MEVCFAEDECGSLLPVRSWGEGRTILWRRLMSGMISAENGRLAAALAGTGLMVDGRSGPGLTWLIIFDFLIIKKTKPLSHLSQCGSGFVA